MGRYSKPVWRSEIRGGWAFHLLLGSDPSVGQITDVEVISPNGRRWVGSVGTLRSIEEVLLRYQDSGEGLSGEYFWISSFVVLREGTVAAAFDAVAHLVEIGELEVCFEEAASDG